MFCKKDVLRNSTKFTGEHLCQNLFFNKVAETLAQVFSCEFCQISKNTFLHKTPPMAASGKITKDSRVFHPCIFKMFGLFDRIVFVLSHSCFEKYSSLNYVKKLVVIISVIVI